MQKPATGLSRDDAAAVSQMALDAAPAAILVVDGDGRIVLANTRSGETFGCAPASLVGARFDASLHADCAAPWREALASLLAIPARRATSARLELRGLRAGEPFPLDVSLAPAGSGSRTAVVVVRDVTEDKLRDARHAGASVDAHKARERLELLLTFAPAFILCVSRQGVIEFINRTLPQYTREETIGSSWLQYFEPGQHAVMTEMLENVFETGSTGSYEVSTPGPDGALVWFESRIAPMRVGGTIVGAVLVSQDVTEARRAQAELLAGRPMVVLGTLASGIAHEINTPVQFVGDSVHFLRDASIGLLRLFDTLQSLRQAASDGAPMRDVVEAAAKAEEEADLPYLRENMPQAFESCISGLDRVSTIVRSLKDFAHPSDEEMTPADLNRAIESSVSIAINEYKYVADLKMELAELPPVTCRPGEIGQAVVNIIVNAAHAIESVVHGTDRKGLITVRTWRDGDFAMISISDTGTGIAESVQPRIFDPFFTTKEVGKGTGQGLAIARTAVTVRHSGQLTFETRMGEGTTFFIRLPVVATRMTSHGTNVARERFADLS